jgi:SOS-response transcriptional repressor LexA
MLFDRVNSEACGVFYSIANNGRMPNKSNNRSKQVLRTPVSSSTTTAQEAAALKELFEQVARGAGVSQERFGLDHDIGSQGMVWQYLNGHRPLNLSVALKFAKGLRVSVADFSPRLAHELHLAGMATAAHAADDSINILRASQIPVVGTARGGDDGYFVELELTGQPDGFVSYPTKRSNAYAIRVKSDRMRPRIKPGEYVIVEPDVPCNPGDEVVVRTKAGRSMITVLHATRKGFVELLALNDDQRPVTLDLSEIESIHHVAGIAKEVLYRSEGPLND